MNKAILAVAAILIALNAPAQDVSSLSDEALEEELARLESYIYPDKKLTGYRGRPTAADYQTEVQMKHFDKIQAEADQYRRDQVSLELGRRAGARQTAEQQAFLDRYAATAEQSTKETGVLVKYLQERLAEDQQRVAAQQQRNEQMAAQNQRRQEAGVSAAESFYDRSRTRAPQPPRVTPVQPGPTGASFPIPRVPYEQAGRQYGKRQSPHEAYESGARAGRGIGQMLRAFRERGKHKRKDEILTKFRDGTITKADYRQLVKDGFTQEAAELLELQRMIDEAEVVE